VLRYFNTTADDYAAIFTPNATGACRLVAEAYPFGRRSRLVLTADNHNSVNGIREFAKAAGARVTYVPLTAPELRVAEADLGAALGRGHGRRPGLFGYPAQSNFSGVQHPLSWIARAQDAGYDVLLDTAAFVPANRLDLSAVRPEFVAMSWYKIFGFPTGWAACWPGGTRWPGCAARGSRAARSGGSACSAAGTGCSRTRARSKTAR
jgi:selenocysteine lyase/cysteine desulfurase